MNKLPADFEIKKYGLYARFVKEEDAPFILKLRTDELSSKYINSTENDVSKQINWIKEYKKRELGGNDYYFIYYHKDKPIGVNRIYDICDNHATTGSWVCEKELYNGEPIATYMILRDIFFDILCINNEVLNIVKENHKVINFHKLFGAQFTHEDEFYYWYKLDKNSFETNKNKILRFINI